jgi:hypothetical protein
MTARTRLCHFVIDVSDLDHGVTFWTEALDAVDEPLPEISRQVYRHLRLPDTEIAVLLPEARRSRSALKLPRSWTVGRSCDRSL